MHRLMAVFGVVALLLFGFSIANMRSDIQMLMAAVGLFSAMILFGLAELLRTLPRR